MIYLDHNATTPLDRRVFEIMSPYMTERWGNSSSPYRFGNQARIAMEKGRARVAECIGAETGEIVFCASGTEADNLAVRGAAAALRARGNHIVTTSVEHHAVLYTCRALEAEGYRVTYLPVDGDGLVRLEELEKSLTEETILVTVMHANNETGVLQPVGEIARIARERGIVFHSDAVQTAGKLPEKLCGTGADLLSFSAHKFYGPKGVGALYVRKGTPISPRITGGPHEHGLRAGTENVPGIVGLATALSLAVESAAAETERLAGMRDRFEIRVLETIPGSRVNGRGAPRVPNTSNLSFDAVDGESIVLGLDLGGICISTGSACSTGDPEPSHVLLAMGLSPKEAQGSVRVSLGRHTEEKELEAAVDALGRTVARLRAISSIQRPTAPSS